MGIKNKRILIKLSGEALAGERGYGIDNDTVKSIAEAIKSAQTLGAEIAIVVGGGNIFRGRTGENMDRTTADHMGMLATVINSLALQSALERAERYSEKEGTGSSAFLGFRALHNAKISSAAPLPQRMVSSVTPS